MFGIICNMALGKITTLDVSALLALITFIVMTIRYNNKRLSDKADKAELIKLESDMREELDCIEERNKEQYEILRKDYQSNIEQVNKTMNEISITQNTILKKVLKLQ